MGMFDYVEIDPKVIQKHLKLECKNCKNTSFSGWQTKDFDSVMETYYLTLDQKGDTRLFLLDPPDDKYFVPYTPEEIEEKNKNARFPWWKVNPGDGQHKPEAYLVENRNKRFMGELPHQICNFYTNCENCKDYRKGWIELEVKFTDGVAVKIEQKERNL